jgi:hypothetical protein
MKTKMFFQTHKQIRKPSKLNFQPITGSQQIKHIQNLKSERMVLPEDSRNESQVTKDKKSLKTLKLFKHAN